MAYKKTDIDTNSVHPEKESIRQAYIQHMTDLDVIINNVVGSSLAQTQEAIKTLAQGQEKILKLIKKVLT